MGQDISLKSERKNPWFKPRTTDTQWRHKSKISESLGRCGGQNMLRPYLKIWDWDWIFGRAVRAISSLGVHSPCSKLCRMSNDVTNSKPSHNGLTPILMKYSDFFINFSPNFYFTHLINLTLTLVTFARKQAGCRKEWWTMWKIPTQLKTGWDPFWMSILIFS